MATPTLTAKIQLQGGPEATAQVKAFGDAASAAFAKAGAASAALASGSFGARFSAGIASFKAQFAGLVTAGAEFGNAFRETNKALNEVGTAFVEVGKRGAELAAVVVALDFGFGKLIKSSAENAETIAHLSATFGLSTQKFQELTFATGKVGVAQDQLVTILTRLNTVFQRMKDGAKGAGEAAADAADGVEKLVQIGSQALDGSHGSKAGSPLIDVTRQYKELGITVHEGTKFLDELTKAQQKQFKAAGDAAGAEGDLNSEFGDTHTITQAIAALEKLGFVVKDNLHDNLLELSARLSGVTDAQKRLELESAILPRALAVVFDPFLRQGPEAIKVAEGLADTLKIVKSEAEIGIGEEAKQAFFTLDAAIGAVKDHVGLALAPAFAKFAAGVVQILAQNSAAITAWAADLSSKAIPVINDLIAALSGRRGDVQNKGVIEFIDQLDQIKSHLLAIVGVAGTVFSGLQAAAGIAADAIKVFSLGLVNLNGNTLLAVVGVGKFLGLSKLITTSFGTGVAIFRNFAAAIRVAVAAFEALRLAALFFVATPVGLAITAIVTATALLATRQTAAQKAADEHAQALQDLAQAQLAAATGGKEERDQLVELEQAHLATARAALVDAQNELDAAKVRAVATKDVADGFAKTAESLLGAKDQAGRFEEQLSGLDKAQAMLTLRKQQLDQYVNAIKTGVGATQALTGATQQAGSAAQSSFGAVRSVADAAAGSIKAGGDAAQQTFGAVRSLASAAGPAASSLAKVGTAVAKIGDAAPAFDTVKQAAVDAFEALKSKGQDAAAAIATTFADMVDGIQSMFSDLAGAIDNIFGAIQDLITNVGGQVQSAINQIITSLQQAVTQARSLADAAQRARLEAQSAGSGLADGGPVAGPGSGTSDSIMAWLSNGEFVLSARAVRHWGIGFLAAMNSLRNPFQGFSLGGMVDTIGASLTGAMTIPRFADGGPVLAGVGGGSMRTVRLEFQLGDQVFVAQTDEQTVAGLSRAAAKERMLSIGSPPRRIAR